ncbi:ABC transporter substrate-binding protein [Cylindrospermopsis raciborskii]|uniref:Nitrate ABC transporter substrate-binding protein n=1 Tax=Cylindrospermopsis raciborskii CENA302 TaxID=1170768 RepID=A0A9Q5QYY7_9CYAN|nr:ABC transporter substrate-binding protein [Cylindrospermopsis raciborskii]NLQ03807.1 ABC transporter substrate-binding protein [Cylindrospermopsis raciborskii MVCC19]OHY33996.1 nitrate ABC transporter substrate-binding protein [Cylindrospermopsis raciborskii MVCC14]OPH10987.1 nitrate ABC transporter substrate-binding protein [Cylindrospermopsis raciborskii CENA302]
MEKYYQLKRRQFIKLSSLALAGSISTSCSQSSSTFSSSQSAESIDKLDKVKLLLSWKAEAEYGGFYQAVAKGIYRQYGLDVTIQPGSPQTNGTQLLMGGVVDFIIGGGLNAIKAVEQGIPKITVASIFQKEIQVLLTHPGVGNDSFEDLKGKPIYLSIGVDYWPIIKAKYGLSDDQKRPYNFNVSPFLLDKNSAQQGLLTSEPYTIEKEGGFKPNILLLADAVYNPYSFTIETTKKLVETNPDLVQRFVDGSIKGWYSYLENPQPANELIKKDNPEMTEDLMDYGLNQLKAYEVIMSGDAKTLGIGAMNNERWETLFKDLVSVGIVDAKTNYKQAYTLRFVNKGMDYYKNS